MATVTKLSRVRGMRDISENLARIRRKIRNVFVSTCHRYGFQEVEIPIIENSTLYKHSLGSMSDIVHREMFQVLSPNQRQQERNGLNVEGDNVNVLRPEGTAGVLRMMNSMSNGDLNKVKKKFSRRIWYEGPMFRYERPQYGRYRQFTQVGIEVVANDDEKSNIYSEMDVLLLGHEFLQGLKLKVEPKLLINTLGTRENRQEYCIRLKQFLQPHFKSLSKISQSRFQQGAFLRILDSKDQQDREIIRNAPSLLNVLGKDQIGKFERLTRLLDSIGVDFVEDSFLVRGLDYYTGLAFEFVDENGQAILGGGAYDNVLGISGTGWAAGLERLEHIVARDEGVGSDDGCKEYGADVAVIVVGDDDEEKKGELDMVREYAFGVVRRIRKLGMSAIGEYNGRNVKKVFGKVAGGGAQWAVTVGTDELARGIVAVKNLASGVQRECSLDDIQDMLLPHENKHKNMGPVHEVL